MATLLEQAKTSAQTFDFGGNYYETVRETVRTQRRDELEPSQVAEPFEKIFTQNEEQSGVGLLVLNIPDPESNLDTPYQIQFEFSPTGHLPSWAVRHVDRLELVHMDTGDTLNLLDGAENHTVFDARGDKFACNPYTGQLCIGWPDSYVALCAIGHEKRHLQDDLFQNPKLASAYLKYQVYNMLHGVGGIPFVGNKRESIKTNLSLSGEAYLKKAQQTIDEILVELLTQEEADILLAAEERAAQGEINRLREILAFFLQFNEEKQTLVMRGAELFAVDGLASYVHFVNSNVGKGFSDWLKEIE